MALLGATVVDAVDFIVVVVNVVVVEHVRCYRSHNIKLWSINVHLGLLKADVEFVWGWYAK